MHIKITLLKLIMRENSSKKIRFTKVILLLFIILFFLCLIGIPAIFLIFGLESDPLIVPGKKLTFQDVERVKQLLKQNDPRRLKAGEIKTVALTERDLNLFLDYALSHSPKTENLRARVELYPNSASGRFTVALPDNPFGAYLNVSAMLSQSSRNINIHNLKIGVLTFPGWMLNPIVRYIHHYLQQYEEYRQVIEGIRSIENIQLKENLVSVTYQWRPDVMIQLQAKGRNLLLTADEQKRLWAYIEQLAIISQTVNEPGVSLARFLQPLFRFAKERTISGADPIAENRALLLALAMYSTGKNLNKILGNRDGKAYQPPRRVRLTLLKRYDLALHFLISAAITVAGSSGLANLAGLFKEMDDSQGGSGFSFADLAADRAGVRLAEDAIGSFRKAKSLQQRMSQALQETDFMPQVDHLPEGIMELEFERRYKDLDSAAYRIVDQEIEWRIENCRIYR